MEVHREVSEPRIEVGTDQQQGGTIFFVRDNGAGFDMNYAENLFRPFQRLHNEAELREPELGLPPCTALSIGTGDAFGQAVQWAKGATFYFTIPASRPGAPL